MRTLPWKCRRLPEYDSLAPAQCKQACSLLMQLSEVLLNVYAAAIAEGKQGDLEAQYLESRDTLLGTLLSCASGWLQAGTSYLGSIDQKDLETWSQGQSFVGNAPHVEAIAAHRLCQCGACLKHYFQIIGQGQ